MSQDKLYEPQQGIWTLTAPDGRTWQAESGLLAAAKEQRERIPPDVMLERINAALSEPPEPADRERIIEECVTVVSNRRAKTCTCDTCGMLEILERELRALKTIPSQTTQREPVADEEADYQEHLANMGRCGEPGKADI